MAGMNVRKVTLERKTRESSVSVELSIDGSGQAEIATGVGFLDHMLDALARHGLFDLKVKAEGDLVVDAHHTAEDVAITLGRAFDRALGERRGIVRIAHAYAPLDEALALVVVDLGGRGYSIVEAEFASERIGDLDSDLVRHFFETLGMEGRMNVHARLLAGRNAHHQAECLFKALARALDAASRVDERLGGQVPSTKGMIDRGVGG
jgi:imidazoleglycerol-phosphate dehydratase